MAAKAILVLCAQALLAQVAFSQCLNYGLNGAGLAGAWGPWEGGLGLGLGAGCGCGGVASTGGGLAVGSASPIPPVGLSVLSENVYEGGLAVGGNLPFLGTVGLEGILPTAGAGAVSYGCGNGAVGIGAEAGPIVTGIAAPGNYAPAIGAGLGAGLGYGINGIGAGLGYGINGIGAGLGYGINGIGAGLGLGGIGGCGCGGWY